MGLKSGWGLVCAAVIVLPVASHASGFMGSAPPVSCKVDRTQPSEADVAFFNQNFEKAAKLYAKAGNDGRSRMLEISSIAQDDRLTDAIAKSDAWNSADPKNSYAIVAAAGLRRQEGDWIEAYALMLKAIELDPCNPFAFAGLGAYERDAGYHAKARQHYTLAHELLPLDPTLRMEWIWSLGSEQRIAEEQAFYKDLPDVTGDRREGIATAFRRDAAEAASPCQLVSVTGPVRIPMLPLNDTTDRWGINVSINGHDRLLMLSTAETGLFVAASTTGGLGLERYDQGVFDKGAGNATYFRRAVSVRIGGAEFSNCPVHVAEQIGLFDNQTHMGQQLDAMNGEVGLGLFDRYLVTVDYIKHEIRLDPLPEVAGDTSSAGAHDELGGDNGRGWKETDRNVPTSMRQQWVDLYSVGTHSVLLAKVHGEGKPALMAPMEVAADNVLDAISTPNAKLLTSIKSDPTLSFGVVHGQRGDVFDTGPLTVEFAGIRMPIKSMKTRDFFSLGGTIAYDMLSKLVLQFDFRDGLARFRTTEDGGTGVAQLGSRVAQELKP